MPPQHFRYEQTFIRFRFPIHLSNGHFPNRTRCVVCTIFPSRCSMATTNHATCLPHFIDRSICTCTMMCKMWSTCMRPYTFECAENCLCSRYKLLHFEYIFHSPPPPLASLVIHYYLCHLYLFQFQRHTHNEAMHFWFRNAYKGREQLYIN